MVETWSLESLEVAFAKRNVIRETRETAAATVSAIFNDFVRGLFRKIQVEHAFI